MRNSPANTGVGGEGSKCQGRDSPAACAPAWGPPWAVAWMFPEGTSIALHPSSWVGSKGETWVLEKGVG